MKKYKVLLVDDEPIILQGLQILIDWEALDLEITGLASDGLEGLEMIRNLKPDIVITDIQMPNCTGVDMIDQAHTFSNCKFIALSGYSDFAYAKQCISFGVQEYLLKPVVEEELIKALEKVKAQIDHEEISSAALNKLDDMSQQLHDLTMDDILRDIMNSYFENDTAFYTTLSDYELDFPAGNLFFAAALQTNTHEKSIAMRSIITEQINLLALPYLLFYYGNSTYIAIFSLPPHVDSQTFLNKISALHASLSMEADGELCIGIGNAYPLAHQLPLSCEQAVHALSYKIVRGSNSINPFNSNLKNAYFIQAIPEPLWDTYRQSLLQSNFASISNAIQKIFSYMINPLDLPLLGIQIITLNLIMTCIQYLAELASSTQTSCENTDFMQQISSIQSADELQKYTENIIYNLLSRELTTEIAKPKELISRIENYINSNYLEDLSLMTVAQLFYISPIYLSQTFKKQTGQLYLDYVTQIKINAAKRLLLSTDLMVYEIADRLHYKDSKYFSRLFEKKTGKKPSEFRKNP